MSRARGERTFLAGAFESTEKTAPGSGYSFLSYSQNSLGLTRPLVQDDIVGTRDPGEHDIDIATINGDVQIPMDVHAIGWWLKLLLGAPSTTDASGVYTHVYESGAWSLPSASFEAQKPDVPSYEMFRGVRAERMRYSMQRGGWVNSTVSLIGQAADAPGGTTSAGSPTSYDLTRLVQAQGKMQIGGSDYADVVQCDFDYANNLDQVGTVTGDEFIGGLDPMRAALSLSLRIRFATETLFNAARAGTPVAVNLIHQIDADNMLTLAMPRVFLDVPNRPVTGAGGIEATFSAMTSRDTDGSAMLTATLINDVSAY